MAVSGGDDALSCSSLGSIGHPHACALACKYNGRAAGCKDGLLCRRCHICIWSRSQHKTHYTNLSTLNSSTSLAETHCDGISTPDPPLVFKNSSSADESDESFLAGATTPPDGYQPAGFLLIGRELQSKLCALVEEQDEAEATPKASGVLAQRRGGGAAFAQAGAAGTKAGTVVATAPPGLPTPPALLTKDADVSIPPPPPVPEQFARYPDVISIGTVGHPKSCAMPCKYARRKMGCRDGAQCARCHRCQWQRKPAGLAKEPATTERRAAEVEAGPMYLKESEEAAVIMTQEAASMPAPGLERATDEQRAASAGCFSVGSIGHPLSCAGQGCKYNRKPKGCKDGRFCLRCHLCPW